MQQISALTQHFKEIYNKDIQSKKYSISMIASENKMSPAASILCGSDFHNRYYFDSDILWGQSAFPGGRYIGEISKEILIPLLKKFTKARYVNVKPLSGLNCMTMVLASYCKANDLILTISPDMGGHYSTYYVARNLKLDCDYIQNTDCYTIDLEAFRKKLQEKKVTLIYIDQANCLFPLDIKEISAIVKDVSPTTYLHVDTSHTNGLIFGEVIQNPLENGADSFGGSTHKTLPGPQKAFFATSDQSISERFNIVTMHMISNCHTGNILALAVTLLEFDQCNGKLYANRIVENAKTFADVLSSSGIIPQAEDRGFTECHQIWIDPSRFGDTPKVMDFLISCGIFINTFPCLPGLAGLSFRVGLNEPTRLGFGKESVIKLANVFINAFKGNNIEQSTKEVMELCKTHKEPAYCFDPKNLFSL